MSTGASAANPPLASGAGGLSGTAAAAAIVVDASPAIGVATLPRAEMLSSISFFRGFFFVPDGSVAFRALGYAGRVSNESALP
jgi:hypothetical protein